MDWVVRAGAAAAGSLIKGYRTHARTPGLYSFSVQFAPGKTVHELAQAGQFPHPLISYATTDALAAALRPLGYSVRLVKSPGQGYHHTFAVLYDANGTMLQTLPRDAALALGLTFRRRPNPYQVP